MPLRRRMTVAVAVAVAVAVVLAAAVAYLAVRSSCATRSTTRAARISWRSGSSRAAGGGPRRPAARAARRADAVHPDRRRAAGTSQVLGTEGDRRRCRSRTARPRRVRQASRPRAASPTPRSTGTHVRVLTVPAPGGPPSSSAARSRPPTPSSPTCALILALVCVGGVALAVALGRLVVAQRVAPIVHVTEAARTSPPPRTWGGGSRSRPSDEVGELAAHFNAMLDTLERSVAAQRQLVADASHELRTPITSLRTNIEVLAEAETLPADERARLLADVEEQTPRARDAGRRPDRARARGRAAARARGRAARPPGLRGGRPRAAARPGRAVRVLAGAGGGRRDARAAGARGQQPARQRRPATPPPGGVVEVAPASAACACATTAPGVADEDLPHLFDRFYRGASARGRPGSGLGLAIVRQVAEQHGGGVHAANAPGGGAEFVLDLPAVQLCPNGRRIFRELARASGRGLAAYACVHVASCQCGHRGRGPRPRVQERPAGRRRDRPGGRARRDLRLPGPERRREVDDGADAHHAAAAHRGHGARRGPRHPKRGRRRAGGDRRRAAGGRARPAAHRPRSHAAADDAAGRAQGAAARARRRADRARGARPTRPIARSAATRAA